MPAKKAKRAISKRIGSSGARKMRSGSRLVCQECGLVLSVDQSCGCIDYCDVICCGQQMSIR